MADPKGAIYEFDNFRLEVDERLLTRNGKPVELSSKAFDLLLALIENSGHLIEKEILYQRVWAGSIVEDSNLTVQMSAIRKALGNPDYIKTIKGHGYRFTADVRPVNGGRRDQYVIESRSLSRITIEHDDGTGNGGASNTYRLLDRRPPLLASRSGKFFLVALAAGVLIAAVWFWPGGSNTSNTKPPKLTRLTTSGRVSAVALTPDGAYMAFVQKESDGESLWLRQIETGSQTRIAPPKNLEYLGLTVSPDGKFVYAPVFLENHTLFWKIPILGGVEQEIPNVGPSAAVSFSPDGKRFVFTESNQPETHLKIADADGANERILIRANNEQRAFPMWRSNPVAWSPDGERIAVGIEEKGENGSRAGILLVDPLDGSEKTLVAPRWLLVDDVAWLDKENIVFIANDDEWSNQIYIANRQTGEVRRFTNDLQKYRWIATAGGKILSAQVNAVSSIYVADYVEAKEKLEPREILRESGYIPNVAWSKDGAIYYSSRTTGNPEIWRIEPDGRNAAQITSGAQVNFGLAVSPSDGSLVFCSYENGKYSIWTADAGGKNLRPLTEGTDHFVPDVSADGKIVFQTLYQKIFRILPSQKTPVELARGLKPVISPDGQRTAYFSMDEGRWRVNLISTDSGELLKKIEFPVTINQRRMRWYPTGRFLTLSFNVGANLNLVFLPIDEGNPQFLKGLGTGEINSFGWSENGAQIVYSLTTETQDAVVISE